MSIIPLTTGRLASSIELKVMTPVSIQLGGYITFDFKPGMTLGTISKMTRDQKRTVKRRYSLGNFAFEPFDLIPGPITTNLNLEKIVLYSEYVAQNLSGDIAKLLGVEGKDIYLSDGDMLGAFGFVGNNLFHQQRPFAIQEIVHAPEGSNKGDTITSYYDCWFTSNPIEYDIHESNQIIIQNCDVACGRVVSSLPIEKAVIPVLKNLLPSSLKIPVF